MSIRHTQAHTHRCGVPVPERMTKSNSTIKHEFEAGRMEADGSHRVQLTTSSTYHNIISQDDATK